MAITPYLLYRDAGAAVDWLVAAFGLIRTGDVFKGEDGRITHASLEFGKALLMLGSPGPDFKGPRALGHATQNLYVDVDDVEAHYARAVRAGATIIEEPKDTFYGARRYGAEDIEGHRWYFAQELAPARTPTKKSVRRKAAGKSKAKVRGRQRPARKQGHGARRGDGGSHSTDQARPAPGLELPGGVLLTYDVVKSAA